MAHTLPSVAGLEEQGLNVAEKIHIESRPLVEPCAVEPRPAVTARSTIALPPAVEPPGCRCGEVLRGMIDPPECPLFGEACTPRRPVGACMVSSEGACQAHYRYRGEGKAT